MSVSKSNQKLRLASNNPNPKHFKYQILMFKGESLEIWRTLNGSFFLLMKDTGWIEKNKDSYSKSLQNCKHFAEFANHAKLPPFAKRFIQLNESPWITPLKIVRLDNKVELKKLSFFQTLLKKLSSVF
jgi:hypothetical protein